MSISWVGFGDAGTMACDHWVRCGVAHGDIVEDVASVAHDRGGGAPIMESGGDRTQDAGDGVTGVEVVGYWMGDTAGGEESRVSEVGHGGRRPSCSDASQVVGVEWSGSFGWGSVAKGKFCSSKKT